MYTVEFIERHYWEMSVSQCSCIAFGVQTFLLLFDAITLSQISLAVVSEKLGGWQRGHVHTYISGKVAEKHYYVYVVLSYDSPWPHEEGSRTVAKRRASCIMYQLSDGTKCTLSIFADDTKPGEEADMPEGCADIQTNLARLEKRAYRNLWKFNKERLKVLHLGKSSPRQQYWRSW